jgi:hypothetical protein
VQHHQTPTAHFIGSDCRITSIAAPGNGLLSLHSLDGKLIYTTLTQSGEREWQHPSIQFPAIVKWTPSDSTAKSITQTIAYGK